MSSGMPIPRLIHLDDYRTVLGEPEVVELRALAAGLQGRTVQMVNSTAVGGGVAEILTRLVPILQELGLAIRWDVMTGGDDFFEITKAFHNALHGGPYNMPPESFDVFLAYNEQNIARLQMEGEMTVIHDPQPVALVKARRDRSGHWIWRCHIDLSRPNPTVWQFLEP
jgi:trehalose synthase